MKTKVVQQESSSALQIRRGKQQNAMLQTFLAWDGQVTPRSIAYAAVLVCQLMLIGNIEISDHSPP